LKNKDIGILIQKKNYSESSLILTFYTEGNGLISFIFKGAKKKKLAVFHLGIYEISYFKRPESNLGIIQSLEAVVPLTDLFSNPQKIIIGFFMVEVLSQTLKTEHSDPDLFHFIKDVILQLEVQNDLLSFPLGFLGNYIQKLGFSPLSEIENPKGFEIHSGQFTDQETGFDLAVVTTLDELFQGNAIETNKETAQKTLQVLLDYYKSHLPHFNAENSLKIIRDTLYV
jgi:DNA repair protein RecO (recombination protein O)